MRHFARIAVERNLDLALARPGDRVGDLLQMLLVLLRRSHEGREVLLELIELAILRDPDVRGAWQRRGQLDTELGDPTLRQRAQQAVDDAVHHALDRRVVRAVAERLSDRLHEITGDADRLLATALGDVEEARGRAVDADGVNPNVLLEELRRERRGHGDERASPRGLDGQSILPRRDLLFRHHGLGLAPYVLGQRVYLQGDAQCYFECITAGTSIVAGAFNGAANGIGVTCPNSMLAPTYGDEFFDDGVGPGLKWKAHFPSGVMVLANYCTLDRVAISGFTGFAVNALCNLDATTYPDSAGNGGANFTNVFSVVAAYCGGGVRFHGGNTNGGMTSNVNTVFLGNGRTDVDAALSLPANTWGQGTCCILDRGQGGQAHIKAYHQFASGPPFRNDNLGGGGNESYWEKCTAETAAKILDRGAPVFVLCSPNATTGGGIVIGSNGRGVREIDHTHADVTYARISGDVGGIYSFRTTYEGAGNGWGWKYSAGFWTFALWGSFDDPAFYVTSFETAFAPGKGWLGSERGMFSGDKATALFRGNWDNTLSSSAIKDRGLRAGFRRTGDVFEGAATKVTLTSDGYRGEPWTNAGSTVSAGDPSQAYPPYILEPTANTTAPQANRSVWKCTVGGTMDGTEPTWSTAAPGGGTLVGDVLTEGGGVEWTLVGFTPHYDVEQRVSKATIPTRLVQVQTTTGAASQVLFTGGVVSKIDLALPEDSMVQVTDLVTVKKASTANGGVIKVESTWVRNGTGAPSQIGSTVIAYNLSGATLDATTVAHVANGNRIELQASPESADTLNWRVFRTQATGEDA